MRPSAQYLVTYDKETSFGELNQLNKPHGSGIRLDKYGNIFIGYFENSVFSTGNYIFI